MIGRRCCEGLVSEQARKLREVLWPDCGGPSNTFLPPHAVRGGKATQTYSFWGVGLNSRQQSTSKNLFLGTLRRGPWGTPRAPATRVNSLGHLLFCKGPVLVLGERAPVPGPVGAAETWVGLHHRGRPPT